MDLVLKVSLFWFTLGICFVLISGEGEWRHGGDNTGSKGGSGGGSTSVPSPLKEKEKARVSRTSSILWHAHQNDTGVVQKLLEEERTLVHARDYDNRTPLHMASLHDWIKVAKFLIEYGANVNAQDWWKNTVKKKKRKKRTLFLSLIYCFFVNFCFP